MSAADARGSVLFLIEHERLASSRVRVTDLLPELVAAGWRCAVEPYPRGLGAKTGLRRRCRRFDVVCVQKKLPHPAETVLLRRACRRLAYDFDDAVDRRNAEAARSRSRSRELKLGAMLRAADAVIAGNRLLAERGTRLGRPTFVVPSAVETRGVPVREDHAATAPFRVGWVGGRGNFPHLRLAAEPLRRLSGRLDLELVVVSSEPCRIPGVRTDFRPWSLATQAAEICRFDAGIMPLPDTPFAAGKCAYKALQCMAAAVPAIMSDVGINRDVATAIGAPLARTPDDFEPILAELATSEARRRELGRRGRELVEREFSVEIVAARLSEVLERVVE